MSKGIIGGIGLAHLTVCEQRPAPDGLNSGSPHVHAVTDEAYRVISGTGRAQFHDSEADITYGMCGVLRPVVNLKTVGDVHGKGSS